MNRVRDDVRAEEQARSVPDRKRSVQAEGELNLPPEEVPPESTTRVGKKLEVRAEYFGPALRIGDAHQRQNEGLVGAIDPCRAP